MSFRFFLREFSLQWTNQDLSSHQTGSLPGATAGKVWDRQGLTGEMLSVCGKLKTG